MTGRRDVLAGLGAMMLFAPTARAEERAMIEDFTGDANARWDFISDQVMGGVSTGRVRIETDGAQKVLRLTGDVSTANRGGFIQARRKLRERLPKGAEGLELTVRGNSQAYYVHIRTPGTVMPWSFYQARFEVTPEWQVVRLPFAGFDAKGGVLGGRLRAESVKSIGIVAYGRDHAADLSVARIARY